MHVLYGMDFRFNRGAHGEGFESLQITARPDPRHPTSLRDTLGHIERIIDTVVQGGVRIDVPDGGSCAIIELSKIPVYNEAFSETGGGFDYSGKYRPASGERSVQYLTASVRGIVRRLFNGTIDAHVTSFLSAGPIINLALLDRILADREFRASDEVQEVLARIATLRAGRRSADPNEWVALLGRKDSARPA